MIVSRSRRGVDDERVVESAAASDRPSGVDLGGVRREVGLGVGGVDVVEVAVVVVGAVDPADVLAGDPDRRNHTRSTSAMCRTSPSRDIDDGGTDRRA